jgi:hypothetical protein
MDPSGKIARRFPMPLIDKIAKIKRNPSKYKDPESAQNGKW